LPARKGEELLDQPRATLGRHGHHIDSLKGLCVVAHGSLKEARTADYDGEEIIEIMRDAPRHLAKRLELLSLAQRVLDLPLLGPVEQSDDGATVLGWIMKNL
jgi:hypothetical protein